MIENNHLKHPGSGIDKILRADLFMCAVRKSAYPSASWLAQKAGISLQTAYRIIRSLRDDLGAPLVYSDYDRGWYLSDPKWTTKGL